MALFDGTIRKLGEKLKTGLETKIESLTQEAHRYERGTPQRAGLYLRIQVLQDVMGVIETAVSGE